MERLKELRKNLDLSQKDISKKLNLPLMTYNNYENNKSEPNIETLCKLADYYDTSVDYLVGHNYYNEFGYLSDDEKQIISMYKSFNNDNKNKAMGYFQALNQK